MYVGRPYNFNLSPLFLEGDRLKLDRKITFSSSACHFLRKNNFNIGTPFVNGITYLSREEEKLARDYFTQNADHSAKIPDMVISPNEHQTLGFYRNARKTISAWTNKKNVCHRSQD